jgi:hypothetical protein
MINFAGLGDAFGEGEESTGDSVGDAVAVGSVLGDVTMAGSDGVVSGEFDACCWLNVQPAKISTRADQITKYRHRLRPVVLNISGGKV